MLQKMGWKEGEGLGSEGQGIKDPINKSVRMRVTLCRYVVYALIQTNIFSVKICYARSSLSLQLFKLGTWCEWSVIAGGAAALDVFC